MKTIPQLLAEFGKQGGCDAFRGDAKQIELVTLYLFVRELTPSLPFELFLRLYTRFAVEPTTEANSVPDVIISSRLPRTKVTAAKFEVRQWSAKEVIGYLSLYVDMVREAELSQQPVPLTLLQWVGDPNLQKMFLDGAFDVVAPVAAPEAVASPVAAVSAPDGQNPAQTAPAASTGLPEASAVVPENTKRPRRLERSLRGCRSIQPISTRRSLSREIAV